MAKPITRIAYRAALVTPENEILLMKIAEPLKGNTFWIMPGGGLEMDESPTQCLSRELYEELGLKSFMIGPNIWHRSHEYMWEGKKLSQSEKIFFISISRFDPGNGREMGTSEKKYFREFKWWTLSQIEKSDEVFVPRLLAGYLRDLIQFGPPSNSIDVGI